MIRCRILLYLGQVYAKEGTTVATFESIANFVYGDRPTPAVEKSVRDEINTMGLTVIDCYGCNQSGVYITGRQLVPLLVGELDSLASSLC